VCAGGEGARGLERKVKVDEEEERAGGALAGQVEVVAARETG